MIAAHHIHRNSHHILLRGGRMSLCLFFFHLKRQFGIDVTAIVAGTVWELGVATLGAAHVMDRAQRMMGAAFALSRFADFHDGLHCELPK
jgi:hypothetical protein